MTLKHFVQILFSVGIVILLNSCSEDSSFIAEEEKSESKIINDKSNPVLAERFAPKIWLHSCENLYPSDPEWFIDRTLMRFTKKGNDAAITTNVTSYNIDKQSYYEGSSNCRKHNEKSGGGYPSNFFLQIPNNSSEDDTRRGNSNLSQLKLVVSVRDREGYPGLKTIQYWMFYPFNALCSTNFCANNNATECGLDGAHEGDWEHITVVYNVAQDKAVSVYMSAHEGEGRYYSPNEVAWIGDHPVIYSALGSHASYPNAGSINRGSLPNDYTNAGTSVETWTLNNYLVENCETYGCLDIPGVENFIKFSGYWGELGATFANPIPGNGPRGPAYKREFFDGLETRSNYACNYAKVRGITFYEDNGSSCSGDKWWTTDAPLQHLGLTNRWQWTNDEIRSMALSNVRQGTRIRVYDNSCGSTTDDWTEIYVKQDIGPDEVIKITTFEKNANTSKYQQTYHADNGLDGKISLVKITN